MKFAHLRNSPRARSIALLVIASVLAGVSLIAAGRAAAAEGKEAATMVRPAAATGKISKEQATQNALAALPGKVTDVTIEKKRGMNVWVIEIVADKDGGETDVLVDMDSGKVLGMDR